jgi:branched-chain amino acid transport system substrate-binding protein
MKLSRRLAFAAMSALLGTAPASAQDTIKIGVVGALTGAFAATGQSQLTGAEMRAKEINAAGGKYKIELVSEDDASNCNQSANATVKMITQNKVSAILGAVNSPCALAMVPLTQRYKVPQFTFGVGSAITQQGSEWVFRVAVAATGQTRELANYAVKELKKDKIAVLYSDDEYGASMANGFKAALEQIGLKPAAFETFPRADQDFTGQLTTVKRSGATAIYPIGSYVAAALIAKQAKQLGMDLQILGDTGNASPKYIELGGDAVEGSVLVEPFTPADPDPKNQAFVAKYKSEYGRDPDGWVAEMYDAVGMIHEAVVKAGKVDSKIIRDHVAGFTSALPYVGILGKWSFDKTGDAFFPLYKVQVKGGQKVILGR